VRPLAGSADFATNVRVHRPAAPLSATSEGIQLVRCGLSDLLRAGALPSEIVFCSRSVPPACPRGTGRGLSTTHCGQPEVTPCLLRCRRGLRAEVAQARKGFPLGFFACSRRLRGMPKTPVLLRLPASTLHHTRCSFGTDYAKYYYKLVLLTLSVHCWTEWAYAPGRTWVL